MSDENIVDRIEALSSKINRIFYQREFKITRILKELSGRAGEFRTVDEIYKFIEDKSDGAIKLKFTENEAKLMLEFSSRSTRQKVMSYQRFLLTRSWRSIFSSKTELMNYLTARIVSLSSEFTPRYIGNGIRPNDVARGVVEYLKSELPAKDVYEIEKRIDSNMDWEGLKKFLKEILRMHGDKLSDRTRESIETLLNGINFENIDLQSTGFGFGLTLEDVKLLNEELISRSVANGMGIPATGLDTEAILDILERATEKNVDEPYGISSLLEELSYRELTGEQKKRLTEILKEFLRKNGAVVSSNPEVFRGVLERNLHNIEFDEELFSELSNISREAGTGLFTSYLSEIAEVDPERVAYLIMQDTYTNSEEIEEIVSRVADSIVKLKMSAVGLKRGDEFIDLDATLTETMANAGVLTPAYKKIDRSVGDVVFLIDVSGSMGAPTERNAKWKVSILVASIFARVIRSRTNKSYKVYLFADRFLDVSDFEPQQLVQLLRNPSMLQDLLGTGTMLAPALRKLREKVKGKHVILMTDTGDMGVTDEDVRQLRAVSKSVLVLCPQEYFKETSEVFENNGVPVVAFNTIDELIEVLKNYVEKRRVMKAPLTSFS